MTTYDASDFVAVEGRPNVYQHPVLGTCAFRDGQTVDEFIAELDAVPETPLPTSADVIAERERRLSAGFDYGLEDARGVHHIGTTAQDMIGWREVTDLANALIAAGNPTGTIQIVTDTGPVTVTAEEWQGVLLAAAAHRQPIWAASFVLQASDPIPADYADDAYWP